MNDRIIISASNESIRASKKYCLIILNRGSTLEPCIYFMIINAFDSKSIHTKFVL
jgi:hypothetical protein